MRTRTFANAAAVVALGLAAWTTVSKAQGPLYDRVDVNLPYTVTIGDKTLQPGSYVIQQLRSSGGDSRVLLIYSDNGMRFETSAMTIPALDINTARDTKVVLHHFGNDYYFDKVWIQGKDYGYEFPLPNSVKEREKEQLQPVSVAANYSSVSSTDTQTTTAKQTTPPAATTQATNPPATEQPMTTQAQNTPPPATTPSTMPPSTMPPSTTDNSANREMQDTTSTPSTMPHTSAGWLMMLLGGGSLSGLGMCLRRKR
jgi:hypothetical protein